jgi:hypothetical protein
MCGSAVVMLDTPISEIVWRVLATHSIRQFPLHFPSRASPCAITFQLDSTDGRTSSNKKFYWRITRGQSPAVCHYFLCNELTFKVHRNVIQGN